MVAISARRSEDMSPTTTKKLSRHLLHLVSRAQMSPRREPLAPSRSIWRQALLWPSGPAILKKNARVAALERSRRPRSSNQSESQPCASSLGSREIQGAADGTAAAREQENDQPQDDETSVLLPGQNSSSPRKAPTDEDNNLHDLSSSAKKLAPSGLRPTAKDCAIHPATSASPLKVLQPSLPEPPLSIVKCASLFQELREFCANGDAQITMFPDFFSDGEKLMVQAVALDLQLGCQFGEKNIAVYKLLGGHPQQNRSLRSSPPPSASGISNNNHAAEDVYVDVHELAQHGKDGFIAKLRLRRLSSGSGIRRNMLWDVAELSSTADGMADPVSEGEGGVYAVQSRSSGQKLALFKPAEEEKFVREGLFPGEGAVREEAAYVLDSRSNGFSGVPPTAVARLRLTNVGRAKQGAVQRFMSSTMGSMESFGMPFDIQKALEFVPVEQVHRIALLDVRVFNTDRHPGNILLIGEKKPYTMVPIDHGCILPSWFHLSEARFDWLEYPQSREPFSPAALQYIEALDADGDAKLLRSLGIREECVTTLKICTLFLKLSAAQGRTLHWMGNFMARDGCFQQPSRLELAIQSACERAGIPYTFKPNEFDEQRGEIELGVLSRRPPNEFFLALERLLLEEVSSDES
ncbi:Phosphatidylinositol 4-kinase type 2-beta [Phytophthora pseudosyringae]|uniref:Phosphatidylinositol 4-kinase type 2-beta n=1 Tax=Phytophthora pseudosyringae TaxID=221518 RepID=A0A8T1WMU1_9STRA|nr:Phosphatidylinositol 4-kinase type 2-beta [Phytophthora pseudosyringae]